VLSPGQRFYEGLARVNPDGECALVHRGGCDGYSQAHHVYPKRLLKALAARHGYDVDEMVADWRNGMLLCVRHHHQVEVGRERFDRGDMPAVLERFEAAYPALDGLWPRIYRHGLDADEAAAEGVIP
jgi:hypothetical protein